MTPVASAIQAPRIEGEDYEALAQVRPLDSYPCRRSRQSPRARVFDEDLGSAYVGPELRLRSTAHDEEPAEAQG